MGERIGPTNNLCYSCRKPLTQPKRGRMRLTCSNECRQARYRWRTLGQTKWINKQIAKENQRRRDLPFEEKIFDRQQYKAVFELSHGRKVYECMACGDQYIVGPRQRNGKQTFCKNRCWRITRERWKEFNEALRRHERDDLVLRRLEVGRLSPLCAHCGKPFGPNRDIEGKRLPGRPRKYCSTRCGKLAYEKRYERRCGRARRHRFHECAECGTTFDRMDSDGKLTKRFCKPECRHRFTRRAQLAREKAKAAEQKGFKRAVRGRRAAILGSLKNRLKRFDRNESAMEFSGGEGSEATLSRECGRKLGDGG